MKRRSFSLLAAGVLVLLLTGIGGFYWLVREPPCSGWEPEDSRGSDVRAETGTGYGVNASEPDRLESFQQVVALPGERRRSRQELNQLKQICWLTPV